LIEDNGLDEDGYIRIDGSLSKITERFTPLVKEVQGAIVGAFEHQLHSLYLYGSVASGNARPITSDLDILIVFKSNPSSQVRTTLTQLENELSQSFRADVREVGFAHTFVAEVLEGDNQVGWGCFIKHLCVCLTGEDLGTKFPRFKPTRAVGYGLNGDLKQEIDKAKHVMLDGLPCTINKTIMSISRKMVRTTFSLVIEEAHCWTTNLNDCSSIFSAYYPEHTAQIQYLLQISKGAPASWDEFFSILDGFGQWLCDEVEHKLRAAEAEETITEARVEG
jgi:uncharacterized protein